MKKIVLVSICVFFLCSCNSSNKEEKERLAIYNEALLTFSPNYIGHFPFDLTHYNRRNLYVYHPGSTKYNLKAGLVLDTWADSVYFKETYRVLKNRSFTSCSILNDTLVLIGDSIADYSNIEHGKPLPAFSDIHDKFGLSDNRLTGKEIVYFIETKKGEFLENEELVKGLKLPKEWEHGLSRGITVDTVEYRLVYWLVMW